MAWQIACAAAVGSGWAAGLTEITDQVLAFGELLLIQTEHGTDTLERERQAHVRRPDHGAAPGLRGEVRTRWQAQPARQADTLERAVLCPLDDLWICQCCANVGREVLATGQVDNPNIAAVNSIAKQQDLEIRRLNISVHSCLG